MDEEEDEVDEEEVNYIESTNLKGQSYEIFDVIFFGSILPRTPIIT